MEDMIEDVGNYTWNNEIAAVEDQQDAPMYYQPHEKCFEQYDMTPFMSFVNIKSCQEDTEERVLAEFSEWLLSSQTEGFLCTFEAMPDLKHLALGKCPYFHTGMTCQELQEYNRKMEEEEKLKLEIDEFLRKRLRLVQKLLKVYKNAKQGIEEEYMKNLSKNDPYCAIKKKMATKRIVDMMIKQFALEYLYLKSVKIKKEIALMRCILIDTDRLRHLKNILKYTLKTAEKLRYLLEMECNESTEKFEKYFEENTLKDMARMYLTEIENMTASKICLSSEDLRSEQYSEGTSSSEGGVPEYEQLSDFIERGLVFSEASKEPESMSEDYMSTSLDDAGTVSDKQEEVATEDFKSLQEERDMVFVKKLMDEESFKVVLEPEESHNVLEEIRKEILKPDYSLSGEASTTLLEGEDDEERETAKRLAQLEKGRAEAELYEEFKRELWLFESFHYFITWQRPELSGKFKLVHTKCVYDQLLEDQFKEDDVVTTDIESSVESNLKQCLYYLNQAQPVNQDNLEQEENETRESVVPSKDQLFGESYKGESLQLSARVGGSSAFKTFPEMTGYKSSAASVPDLRESSEDKYIEYESSKRNETSLETSNYSEFPGEVQSDYLYSQTSKVAESVRDEMNLVSEAYVESQDRWQSTVFGNVQYPLITIDRTIETFVSDHEPYRSRGSSMPSFTSHQPDPFKVYEKCIRDRELGIVDETTDNDSMRILDDSVTQPDRQIISSEVNEQSFSIPQETKSTLNMSKLTKSLDTISSIESQARRNLSDSSASAIPSPTSNKQQDLSEQNRCFPTLIEVIQHFTKSIIGQSSSIVNNWVPDEEWKAEEEEEVEEEKQVNLDDLINIKWTIPPVQNMKEQIQCEFDTADFLEKLRKSNKQYMRNHPEMSAVTSLILREVTMKRPRNEFIKFIRDTVFNKHFAKRLSSYLAVNNKSYRRKNADTIKQSVHGLKNEAPNVFTFDKPSSEYWLEWGVDFHQMSKRFGPDSTGETPESRDEDNLQSDRDPWDLHAIMEQFTESSRKHRQDVCGLPTRNVTKSLIKEEAKDLKKERTRITALANEVDWELPPDLRSSCQRAYLKRYILDRKKHR